MRERRAAWGRATHGRSRVPAPRSLGRTPSPPECAVGPGALRDARGKLGCGVPVAPRPLGYPSSRPSRGRPRLPPLAPARRGRKRRMRDAELLSSPARRSEEESAPPPRSPRQDRCPGGGGRAARPRNLRRVTLGGCRFPYGGGRRV